MPIVKDIELIPAEIRRIANRLEDGLLFCDDESDLNVLKSSPEYKALLNYQTWADHINKEIENRKQHINQNKEFTNASST